MKRKIGIIGRIADGVDLFDGQTVKTRNLKDILSDINQNSELYVVDTYNYQKNIFSVMFKSLLCLMKCDKIVLSISINGRKVFFPFFYYVNKIFKRDIYHSLIGGRLASNIEKYPSWKKYINSFRANWVESHELVEALNELGVSNAVYLPNFKNIKKIESLEYYELKKPFKFCTFSRVQEQKGIADAINTVRTINEKYGYLKVKLDIYGPIDTDYIDSFNKIINENSSCVDYKGCTDPSKSVDAIKEYFMLLFPTRYYNEGIPGTIIDAMAAGVPVIASKWHYCDEMILNKVNGLVYKFGNEEGLFNLIDYAINNADEVVNMKENCLVRADEYLFENAFQIIKDELNI